MKSELSGPALGASVLGHGAHLSTCWLCKCMSIIADSLKPRLAQSHTSVVIPLYKRVVFIRLLNCSQFSSRLSKISQALDAITGFQFRVGSRGLDERWSLGSVCVSRCSGVGQRRLRSFAQFGSQFIDTAHIALPQRLAFAYSSARLSVRIGLERWLRRSKLLSPETNLLNSTDCRRKRCGSLGFRARS